MSAAKLRVGDYVLVQEPWYPPRHRVGRVYSISMSNGARASVEWHDGTLTPHNIAYLTIVCGNCKMRYEDHAADGKCLYHPTSWKGHRP